MLRMVIIPATRVRHTKTDRVAGHPGPHNVLQASHGYSETLPPKSKIIIIIIKRKRKTTKTKKSPENVSCKI